jgi:hypothetical protein
VPSSALKRLKKIWADACKTMWIEVAAIRHLEGDVRSRYGELGPKAVLTDWIYAPECRGRIDDSTRDFFLDNVVHFVTSAATSRIVLLSAAFESYFEEFLEEYLKARTKYFTSGAFTEQGNKVRGEILKQRGIVARIEAIPANTTATIASIVPLLPTLRDVYTLRNTVAHDAGMVDAYTAASVTSVKLQEGEFVRLNPRDVTELLAPPCLQIASILDERIHANKASK